MDRSKVSAVIVGVMTMAMGAVGILAGLGVLPRGHGDPSVPLADQQAVGITIGVVFAAGGATAVLTAFPGRAVRLLSSLLGFVIVVGLTSLLGWVALGPGSRGFSSPLAFLGPGVNEVSGRIMFGLGALLGLLIIAMMVRGVGRPGRAAEG